MLYAPKSAEQNQPVLVLRPSSSTEDICSYCAQLKYAGIRLLEYSTLQSAQNAIHAGCRVGLLILKQKEDLNRLDVCESFLNIHKITWVGLIAQELIALPIVRGLVAEFLFDFITIPAQVEHIVFTLRHAWGMAFVRDVHQHSNAGVSAAASELAIIGKSPAMQRLSKHITKVARTDATVFISGSSGTGKELVARSLHRQSARKAAPFSAVNCGAIASQLFQSELFGYEKGAFTGAAQRKIGRIEAAQGGTLFLDEIGDMPFDMQANLLRFLQEKTIERLGGTETLPIDVRIIAATHVDLVEAVRQGRFREDLYYRINVIHIATPTLAERSEDIEDIAKYYFARFATLHNKSLRGFSKAAMDALLRHDWPGNVRELVNRIQRAVVMAEGRYIQPEDLDFSRNLQCDRMTSLVDARDSAEGAVIRRALSQSRNQVSRAAAFLGISRVTLYRLIEKHDIRIGAEPNSQAHYLEASRTELQDSM